MHNYETTCYSRFGNIPNTGGESHWVMKDIRLTVGLIYVLGSRTSKPFARYSSQKVHPVVSCESGWSQVNVELMLTSETIMLCGVISRWSSIRPVLSTDPLPQCRFKMSIWRIRFYWWGALIASTAKCMCFWDHFSDTTFACSTLSLKHANLVELLQVARSV